MTINKLMASLLVSTSIISAAGAMERAAPAVDLRGIQMNLRDAARENVMGLGTPIQRSLPALRGLVPNLSLDQVNQCFEELKGYIDQQGDQDLRIVRDEYNNILPIPRGLSQYCRLNAWKALEPIKGMFNYYDEPPISANEVYGYDADAMGVKDILARVWFYSSNHAERENIRKALFKNLNLIIEDDGHRTCVVGKLARILESLQGVAGAESIQITAVLTDPNVWANAYVKKLGQSNIFSVN